MKQQGDRHQGANCSLWKEGGSIGIDKRGKQDSGLGDLRSSMISNVKRSPGTGDQEQSSGTDPPRNKEETSFLDLAPVARARLDAMTTCC